MNTAQSPYPSTTAPSAAGRRTAEDFARASLREEGIADPSIPLLRARLMLDHAREARDLADRQAHYNALAAAGEWLW